MSRPPIVAIRPEPGCSATQENAAAAGLTVIAEPLFEIRPCPWSLPEGAVFDGLLIGSANALRHGGEGLAALRHLPVYAVGAATAQAAYAAGFNRVESGAGGLQNVLDTLAGEERHLLRLTGRQHTTLFCPSGIRITERVAYESRALPMPASLARHLEQGGIVMLHSGVAAHHFRAECERCEVDIGKLHIAALAPRIAAAAGEGWAGCAIADSPDDAALVALVRQLCE